MCSDNLTLCVQYLSFKTLILLLYYVVRFNFNFEDQQYLSDFENNTPPLCRVIQLYTARLKPYEFQLHIAIRSLHF